MKIEGFARRKWAFIVNPVAGSGYAAAYEATVRKDADRFGLGSDFHRTEYPGHARTLAAELSARGAEVVAVVGGDGTISEAAQGLGGTPTVLAPIGAGTGNDFESITGFSERFREDDWDALMQGHVARMDLGVCNGRRFINGMGFGFDAAVAAENYSPDGAVKPGGKGKYMGHILKHLLLYREGLARYEPSGGGLHYSDFGFLNTIAVGRRMAGGFMLTPHAVADDGFLDFCRIERLRLHERLRYLLAVMKVRHTGLAKTHMERLEGMVVEFERESPYHVDGELLFAKRLEIGIEKAALAISFNPAGTTAFGSHNASADGAAMAEA